MNEKEIIMEEIFNTINDFDCDTEIKELLYQNIAGNKDHSPPPYVTPIH